MTSDELKSALLESNVSQADFARLVGVTPRAVNLWINGGRAIPGPADAYLRLFRLLPANLRQFEISRLKERGTGMRDGMYGITFQGQQSAGMGVLVFGAGRIYGSDGGARYDGEYVFNEGSGRADIKLKVAFQPNVVAVFGISHPYEWAIEMKTSLDPKVNFGHLTVETPIGKSLQAQYIYLRTLPDSE